MSLDLQEDKAERAIAEARLFYKDMKILSNVSEVELQFKWINQRLAEAGQPGNYKLIGVSERRIHRLRIKGFSSQALKLFNEMLEFNNDNRRKYYAGEILDVMDKAKDVSRLLGLRDESLVVFFGARGVSMDILVGELSHEVWKSYSWVCSRPSQAAVEAAYKI